MKKILFPAVLAVAAALSLPSQAATATDDFNVSVTLTSACRLSTLPGDIALTYTSFTTTAVTNTSPFAVECTNSLPYDLSLSSASADQLGLTVNLAIRNAGDSADITTTQAAGTTPTGYLIKATIPANQQGTCATGTCSSSVTRTLTVTY